MRIRPAPITRIGFVLLGAVWIGAGLLIGSVGFPEIWALVLGAILVGAGLWMLWRVPRLGLVLQETRGHLSGALWSRAFDRSSVRAISEWPPVIEVANSTGQKVVQLMIFYAPGDPRHRGATFDARATAVGALSDWSGVSVDSVR